MNLSYRIFLMAGVAIALGLALFVSPFASSSPDGLERVAEDHGVEAAPAQGWAPFADYAIPGVSHEGFSTALAGVVGTLAVFGGGLLLARVSRRRSAPPRS